MILAQANTHGVYLHCARDYRSIPHYVVVYGLEVTHHGTRGPAFRHFWRCLNHAEECETGTRPDETNTGDWTVNERAFSLLTDAELLHYATLSDDPGTRRLAEIAGAAMEMAETLLTESETEMETLERQHGEYQNALERMGLLGADNEVAHPAIDRLERLAEQYEIGAFGVPKD